MQRPTYLTLLRPAGEAPLPDQPRPVRAFTLSHDPLCGIPTRQSLIEKLETLGDLSPNSPLSFILVRVEGLGEVNRQEGFAEGDAVLRRVADMLTTLTRPTDFIGRFTSASFGVVLQGAGATAASAAAARLEHHLRQVTASPSPITISVSAATGRGLHCAILPLAAADSLTSAS